MQPCLFMCMSFSCYALALSAKVVFAPHSANEIAVFDTATNNVEFVDLNMAGDAKFYGVATVGSKAVLAPHNANEIAVFDAATNNTEFVGLGNLTGNYKFFGAAAAP